MNNTLTAKEWLEKEELFGYVDLWKDKVHEACEDLDLYPAMERYTNYKNRMLEAKILEFRNYLKSEKERNTINSDKLVNEEMKYLFNSLFSVYDKHFNINTNT